MVDKGGIENYFSLERGCSVTKRIELVKQPRGGYIHPKTLKVTTLGEGLEGLDPVESIPASLVGTAVDYLTRYFMGSTARDAFRISLTGAFLIHEEKKAIRLLSEIKCLDERSITCAVKLCGFDVCKRAGKEFYKPIEEINPDRETLMNIKKMVIRSLHFFDLYGPIVLNGFTFEGGYTDVVSTGDGDYATEDTLWDFKVSKKPIKKEQTLQLLMYWRMGLHSVHQEFKRIKYLGIYNPRTNTMSRIAVRDITSETIQEVEKEVIGY